MMDRSLTHQTATFEPSEAISETLADGAAPLPAPLRALSGRAVVLCFLFGTLVFIGAMALLVLSLGGPGGSRAGGDPLLALAGEPTLAEQVAPAPVAAPDLGAPPEVRVFFTPDGRSLKAQVMTTERRATLHERLVDLVEKLLSGPGGEALSRTVPEGTTLRAAYVRGDLAIVDLGGALCEKPQGGAMAEILCAYAVVNTIAANLDAIRRVRILSNGQPVDVLWDQVDLSEPLAYNERIVRN